MMLFCCVPNPIVVVISPLVNLMEDQTNFFTGSENLDWVDRRRQDCQREDRERRALCSVYFTGHLSLLGNGRCIDIKGNLIGIVVDEAHCIGHW